MGPGDLPTLSLLRFCVSKFKRTGREVLTLGDSLEEEALTMGDSLEEEPLPSSHQLLCTCPHTGTLSAPLPSLASPGPELMLG